MRVLFFLASCCAAAGCASLPDPVFHGEIVELTDFRQTARYWLAQPMRFHSHPQLANDVARSGNVCGKILYQIVIDSTGKVVEMDVLESNVGGAMLATSNKAIRMARFEPADSNPERLPVRTLLPQTFKFGKDADCPS